MNGLSVRTTVLTVPYLLVMDNNSIGASQGVPLVFDTFTLLGTFTGVSDSGALTGLKPRQTIVEGRNCPLKRPSSGSRNRPVTSKAVPKPLHRRS